MKIKGKFEFDILSFWIYDPIVLLSEAYGTACSITWWTFEQQVKCITGNWKGWIQNLLVDPCGLSDYP